MSLTSIRAEASHLRAQYVKAARNKHMGCVLQVLDERKC